MASENQKEGNGKISTKFAHSASDKSFTSEIFHHRRCQVRKLEGTVRTYPKYGRIAGYGAGLGLLRRLLLDAQILHVAASEDDVLIDLIGWRNLFLWAPLPSLRAKRLDIFEGDCGLLRVDLVEGTNVAKGGESDGLVWTHAGYGVGQGGQTGYRSSR